MKRAAVLLLAASMASSALAAGEVNIWRSFSKGGMPIFTDTPAGEGGQLVFSARPPAGPAARLAPLALPAAPTVVPRTAAAPADVLALAHAAAQRHGLDTALIMAMIEVESKFRHDALSSAGAIGLMQLMPQTARRFGVADPWNAQANVDGGTRYLSHLLTLFEGDLRLALAGYNAGEGSVIAAGRRIPPYAETRRYVPAVLERQRHWSATLGRSPAR